MSGSIACASQDHAPGVQMRAVVSGCVQGVSFRFYTRQQAQRLGLTGWVRNEADGTVHVLAQGPRATLLSLLGWLNRGPGLAEVTGVQVLWEDIQVPYSGFEVRY